MLNKLSAMCCAAAVVVMTAGAAVAQTATDTTQAAANQAADTTTDAGITSAVKTRLLADKTVGGLKIDVDTRDGVVTLSGRVSSAAERAEAARLAGATKGVKSVRNDIVLDTAATSGRTDKDDKLTIEIKDDTKETAEKIKDASKKGAEKTADAAKKVGSATKKGAEKTVDAVKDTKVVIKDDTTPKLEQAGDKTTDAAITSAVKSKFLADTEVAGLKIDVDTKDHVVTLTGNVKSEAEKAEAIRLAKTTSGVKSVVDKLVVVR
jgi:hyperosmotically inducible periplasmic protein